jgi:hypothetical protein
MRQGHLSVAHFLVRLSIYTLLFFICRRFSCKVSSSTDKGEYSAILGKDSDDEMSDTSNGDGEEEVELGKMHVVEATRKRRHVREPISVV